MTADASLAIAYFSVAKDCASVATNNKQAEIQQRRGFNRISLVNLYFH
jgi:hypothetical protein